MRIVALAGGVGGAKLVDGLSQCLPAEQLSVIVNTGDDFYHLGLKICPDLDTVCYTLAGLASTERGWGREDESWRALDTVSQLKGPTWFKLGDLDLGLHLERTRRIQNGEKLSDITRDFCNIWGIDQNVLPMTDDTVSTIVITEDKEFLPFQEYFVRYQYSPRVSGFRFDGIDKASPASGVMDALKESDCVVLCPSNPWVSLDPILSFPEIYSLVEKKMVVGVSPLISGKAVKGPAAKMYLEMGQTPSATTVARHYKNILDGFIIDKTDIGEAKKIEQLGIKLLITNILMFDRDDRVRLAEDVCRFSEDLNEIV